MNEDLSGAKQKSATGSFWLLLLLLGGTLAVLCRQGFRPYEVSGPTTCPWARWWRVPPGRPALFSAVGRIFTGWAAPTSPSRPIDQHLHVDPVAGASPQILRPLSMFFLDSAPGFCSANCASAGWLACSRIGGGLNMHYFSNACWGLGQWSICSGLIFIALGILVSPDIENLWIKGVLAGLSTGMAVMEGFDVGAILSIYVAVFCGFPVPVTESDPAKGGGKRSMWGRCWW